MDPTILETAVRSAGVLPSAVEDAVRRLQGHFEAHSNPSPEMISQQLASLKEVAPYLFPRGNQLDAAGTPAGVPERVWRHMAPSAKLAWAREHQPLPVVERRRPPLPLSAEQVAMLAALKPEARLAAYRALQAQQQRS